MHTILVPQGAEYQAVCRGLNQVRGSKPTVVAIPMGVQPLRQYLQQWVGDRPTNVLLMGLCGSLSPKYGVGDLVLYQSCIYEGNSQECHTQIPYPPNNVRLVKGLTSDRLIWSAAEKRHLGRGVDVVDMEGFAALEFFLPQGVPTAMLRVVSDDEHHDIPDLTPAFNSDGSLQPLAATRLIRGSLVGLKVLEQVTKLLFSQ